MGTNLGHIPENEFRGWSIGDITADVDPNNFTILIDDEYGRGRLPAIRVIYSIKFDNRMFAIREDGISRF